MHFLFSDGGGRPWRPRVSYKWGPLKLVAATLLVVFVVSCLVGGLACTFILLHDLVATGAPVISDMPEWSHFLLPIGVLISLICYFAYRHFWLQAKFRHF